MVGVNFNNRYPPYVQKINGRTWLNNNQVFNWVQINTLRDKTKIVNKTIYLMEIRIKAAIIIKL